MKIAIIGASGFIGTHIIPFLLKEEELEVVLAARNVNKLSAYSNTCKLVELDIYKKDNFYQKLHKPEIILDLAWNYLSNYYAPEHFEKELSSHYHFIKQLVYSGVQSICVVGTCFEYGKLNGELSESMVTQPHTPYGYAKSALRQQLEFLQLQYSFNLTWMRLFYIYAEDQKSNTLYAQLLNAVNNKEKVFNMSKGEQLRDYLHVDEAAQKMLNLSLKKENLGVVNICSGQPSSIRTLVEKWLAKNDWNIKLNLGYYPYPNYEALSFWGSTEKLHTLLDYKKDA